jgi:hypothetical protein
VNAVWIVVGLLALTAIVATLGWLQKQGRRPELGYVSHQWINEHRLSQMDDHRR